MEFHTGDIVQAEYKTGVYIGEIVQEGKPKAKVRILAVVRHPKQGDLHHPMSANVSMFHQRRALAFREVALVPVAGIRSYKGTVPEYKESLRQAIHKDLRELEEMANWAGLSLQSLRDLNKDYGFD